MIKRIVLEVDEDMHRDFKIKAAEKNRSMKLILLELLKKWLTQ